ncbi:MAG TPA: hypothetical protein VN040_11630 [Pseudosphingobacterium sp.]|nr:hypothetical protein [Pseudosphingobacterium sp.]
MNNFFSLLLLLFILLSDRVQAIVLESKDSCDIKEYRLHGTLVIGKAGLKLADRKIPYPMDGHYPAEIKYFRIEVKKLFILIANTFSEERIKELSGKDCTFYPYMYFDTTGVNIENYFFLNKGQSFKAEEICTLDSTFKKEISAWYAKHGYEEWALKRSPYLLLYYSFKFSDILKFLKDDKTFPSSVTNIPASLQERPMQDNPD